MKSMTGYGVAKFSNKELNLEIAVRSVNGRFLEIRLHCPREYNEFEAEMKKVLTALIERGTVDVFISRKLSPQAKQARIMSDEALGLEWLKAYRALGKKLKLSSKATMETLLRVPDVLRIEEGSELIKNEKATVLKVLKKAAEACVLEREREGLSLRNELERHFKLLAEKVQKISELRHEANAQLEEKYLAKLKKLGLQGQVDEQRLAQEIVMQMDRADVSEEISRLGEHLKMFSSLVVDPQSQGKKMDFYTQELLREVNTIGSKSNLAPLTQNVVEAKTVVEKIREQVQNVE